VWLVREGVDGGVVMCKEVAARGCGFDGRWFMSSGKMAAINNALVSVDDEVMAEHGPARPRCHTMKLFHGKTWKNKPYTTHYMKNTILH
jgi:hypothetical protein